MKVGHIQLECRHGDYEANIAKVLEGLERADEEGVGIVSFPESMLTGFFDDESRARQHSLAVDGAEIASLLSRGAEFRATFLVGFNERRGEELYNTVLIAQGGRLLGTYSKAFPVVSYFTPGRRFPVFEHCGLRFGVVICADGGFIEPSRILALKGAKIIFAPHYNYITKDYLLHHFQQVRSDHIARARENAVWFLRGNNVVHGRDAGLSYDGVGYGDSYLLDPNGEIVARSQRDVECFIFAEVDTDRFNGPNWSGDRRSRTSAVELGDILRKVIEGVEPVDGH